MSRRANSDARCDACHLLRPLCICALIPAPPLVTRTHLVLIVHRLEARKPTNTGLLAARCLAGADVMIRGHEGQPSPAVAVPPGTRPVLLFPAADAVPLDSLERAEPVTLIVPDGTWRQAAKVRGRVPGLDRIACATLPPGPPTRYRLRAEPVDGGLATFEAIGRALAILEDDPAIAATLDRVFLTMVERTLWARGQLPSHAVTTGLPPGLDRAHLITRG